MRRTNPNPWPILRAQENLSHFDKALSNLYLQWWKWHLFLGKVQNSLNRPLFIWFFSQLALMKAEIYCFLCLKLLYLHLKVIFRDPNEWDFRYHYLFMVTMIQSYCIMYKERADQPVWVLLCLCNSSLLVNRLPQKIQLHTNGLSPVCQRRCARRWDVLP